MMPGPQKVLHFRFYTRAVLGDLDVLWRAMEIEEPIGQ
jgi:hypothetical protein